MGGGKDKCMIKVFKYLLILLFVNSTLVYAETSTQFIPTLTSLRTLYLNLDEVTNANLNTKVKSLMIQKRAEAFLSNLIYDLGKVDIGHKYYYGKYKYAKLLWYDYDNESGFTAGFFQTNTGKYIVAFGGTSAESIDEKEKAFADIFTDLNLLNYKYVDTQYSQCIGFMDKVKGMIGTIQTSDIKFVPQRDVSITGHSLGGGLAQFGALYSGYQAVTYNTAPISLGAKHLELLGNLSSSDIENRSDNIQNIMTLNDPLSSIVEGVEAYILDKYTYPEIKSKRFKYQVVHLTEELKSILLKIPTEYPFYTTAAVAVGAALTPITPYAVELLKKEEIQNVLYAYAQGSSWYKMFKSEYTQNDQAVLLEFLRTIKAKSVNEFVDILREVYGISDEKDLTKLIYGKRIYLPEVPYESYTTYGHSMKTLIESVYGKEAFNASYLDLKIPEDPIFDDVPKNYTFFNAINILAKKGVVKIASKFHPSGDKGKATRGEFFKMLSLLVTRKAYETFNTKNMIMVDAIKGWEAFNELKKFMLFVKDYTADEKNALGGMFVDFSDMFNEDKLSVPIKRKEAIVFIYMFVLENTYNGADRKLLYQTVKNNGRCSVETDWQMPSEYARNRGIVQGYDDGCFKGYRTLDRGEMAAILVNTKNWIDRNYYELEGLK